MNAIQPFASKVPYMGAVGNHECGGANLQHYARRFGGLQEAAKNSIRACFALNAPPCERV